MSFAFTIPDSCRELAHLQVSQWPDEPDAFERISQAEWQAFAPLVEWQRVKTILDLGCGLGRMACWINAHVPGRSFVLADFDEVSTTEPRYEWEPGDERYSIAAKTREFCATNGLSAMTYRNLAVLVPSFPRVDLVVSFLAVGFHWPIPDWLLRLRSPIFVFGVRANKYRIEDFTSDFGSVYLRPGFCEKEQVLILQR